MKWLKVVSEGIEDALLEVIWHIEALLPDPDEGLELKPEVIESLRDYLRARAKGSLKTNTAEEVKRELGLE